MQWTRTFEIFDYRKSRFPNSPALIDNDQGEWRSYDADQCIERINQFSQFCWNQGVRKEIMS